ncbi:ribokinase [Clostridium sp. UBA1652]|uniref:ribokinase n=1 Tax=Clostridium sp. UBA1652 TaxID=1946348 RepID=UPI00257AF209|nr:ribokinase [Clostridium sp. UBA1652]
MKVCIIGSYAKALVMTVDRIPIAGETLIGWDYRGTFGGKGSDMAVQATRLGAEVTYIGVVGSDFHGQEFIELMKNEGIDISGLRVTDKETTGTGFIVKDVNAKNMIVVAPGANNLFSKEDIDINLELINESKVVLAQLEIPIETALYSLKKGKESGKITILNPAPAVKLVDKDLSFVDILTPNETEARIVAGIPLGSSLSNQAVADIVLKTGCKAVVMTLGDKGSEVFTKEGSYKVDSYKIDVVDSNGAGDSFNASLATALSRGGTLEEGVNYGNAVAALCCTKWETVPSYHKSKEVEEFIKSYKKESEV